MVRAAATGSDLWAAQVVSEALEGLAAQVRPAGNSLLREPVTSGALATRATSWLPQGQGGLALMEESPVQGVSEAWAASVD